MMFVGVILLGSCFVGSSGIVAQEKMALDTEQPESFNLGDVIHGNKKMPGMGAWSSIFQRLGSKDPVDIEALQDMLQSVNGDLAGAYMDPGLKQELENQTVQTQIQNITADKELLSKIVRENPMVQQMVAVNPQLAELIQSPEALQRILSPEILQKVQSGGLDKNSLQSVLDTPKTIASSTNNRTSNLSNLSDHSSLLPKMLSSSAPAWFLRVA